MLCGNPDALGKLRGVVHEGQQCGGEILVPSPVSLTQVHRATLGSRVAAHSSFPVGQKVVVKVKHAGVDDAIRRDFAVMMAIADLTSRVPALEHLHLKDNLHQFAAPLREQVRGEAPPPPPPPAATCLNMLIPSICQAGCRDAGCPTAFHGIRVEGLFWCPTHLWEPST